MHTTADRRLGPVERRKITGMSIAVLLLHVLGFGLLFAVVVPGQHHIGSQVFGAGLGITAYVLGMRHAFDADHIAAIDNTTRKLITDGQKPVTVGFWFSLGHSTIVFGMCVALALGIRSLAASVSDDDSTLHAVTSIIGPTVSGVFLIILGIINLIALIGIIRVFARMRSGDYSDDDLEHHLTARGGLTRIFGRLNRVVRKPWHIYPIGVLFGLGFDTATEISLLVLAGSAAATALPWYAILTLPLLFTAGMSLLDSADGAFMHAAYQWAFDRPVRKVYYNMTVTSLSVAVALIIGVIELLQVLADRLGVTTGLLGAVSSISLDNVGYVVVGLFVLTWLVSVGVWRFGRIEQRWTDAMRSNSSSGPVP